MNRKSHKKKAEPPHAHQPVSAPAKPTVPPLKQAAAKAKSGAAAEKPAAVDLGGKASVKESLGGTPRFVRCQLVGPDGKTRPGWEMWLGEHCFGRADRKEILLKSLGRQQQPPQSFHWREVHRQRFERTRTPKDAETSEEDEAD